VTHTATFITLLRCTQKGIENVRESPNRLDSAKSVFPELGREITSFHLVMGRYDAVVVSEAPSDEVVAKPLLSVCSKGTAQTETLRAFPEDEFRKIASSCLEQVFE
jgi:uncharacterized protein with GYD domain